MEASCARCGGATRPEKVQGLAAQVCTSCGAVTLDAIDQLARLTPSGVQRTTRDEPDLGLGSSNPFERETRGSKRRTRSPWSGVAIAVTGIGATGILAGAVALGFGAFVVVSGWVATQKSPQAPPAVAAPAPQPAPAAAPEAVPEAAPEAVPAVVVPEEPAPQPEPVAAQPDTPETPPAPVSPKPSSKAALVKEGWSIASRDPATAADKFRSALALAPGDPEASYGLGYCLSKLGNLAEANPHLCTALAAGDVDVVRDVRALLERSGLSCP